MYKTKEFYQEDWLGKEWRRIKGKDDSEYPTFFEVQEGIFQEAKA